jgi:hypothetical protein
MRIKLMAITRITAIILSATVTNTVVIKQILTAHSIGTFSEKGVFLYYPLTVANRSE